MPLEFLSPLHKASRQLSVYLEAQTRAFGISPPEGHLITYLHSYAPAPVGELVRVFGHKQSTLTSMLHRLEQAGWLRREINGRDRRSFLIHITPEGHALADQLGELWVALEANIRGHVTPAEVAGFHAVTRAIGEITQVTLRDR
jgi:MarR family transcriptional regulator, organic hydroperoxide resistance regulator